MTTYNDEQRAEYLELASEIGPTRAMRKLGYPNSWATGKRWMDSAGIEVPLDEIKAQAQAHNDWYTTEDMLLVAQQGIIRTNEMLTNDTLSPDEHKKVSEAFQKYANTWLLLQGKANSINENRIKDSTHVELMDVLNKELERNELMDMEAKS